MWKLNSSFFFSERLGNGIVKTWQTAGRSPQQDLVWKLVPIIVPALTTMHCLSLWSDQGLNVIGTSVSIWTDIWIDRIHSGDATTDLMKLEESETMQTGTRC